MGGRRVLFGPSTHFWALGRILVDFWSIFSCIWSWEGYLGGFLVDFLVYFGRGRRFFRVFRVFRGFLVVLVVFLGRFLPLFSIFPS